jgi:hypothetical protein
MRIGRGMPGTLPRQDGALGQGIPGLPICLAPDVLRQSFCTKV